MPRRLPPAPRPRAAEARRCRGGVAMLAALSVALLPGVAAAQKLTIGVANPVSSADPHISNTTSNFAMTGHVFETLVARDAQLRLQPGLAESWKPVGDTVWEFRLRDGVAWHDGKPFTADDVAF
ncbi:ABC transporter substrate-binding protein, partial [Teichococcus deserti]|uniref:ABC transporter substrate-binding protein n=1 Tax=Teichococcus deserti TaxID=1817963 RepID=UPI001F6013C9